MDKKIVKLNYDEGMWSYTKGVDYGVEFLGEDFNERMIKKFIQAIKTITQNINGENFPFSYGTLLSEDSPYFTKDDLEYLANINECIFGTTGYSPWSYYVAYHDVSTDFIRDLWEGWNWYVVSLIDEDGEVEDSIGGCYLPNTEDLKECVLDNLGVTDFYLVENDASTYFHYPKIKEIRHISYSYRLGV